MIQAAEVKEITINYSSLLDVAKNKKGNLGDFLSVLGEAQELVNMFLKMLLRVHTNAAALRELQRHCELGMISSGFSSRNLPHPPFPFCAHVPAPHPCNVTHSVMIIYDIDHRGYKWGGGEQGKPREEQ